MQRPAHRHLVLGIVTLLLSSACGDNDGDNGNSVAAGGQGGVAGQPSTLVGTAGIAGYLAIENPCGTPDGSLNDLDAAGLFGATTIPTFDVFLPAETWTDLQVHARDEQFVPAQACFDGKPIGLVGLRFKGSYGSLYNCFDAAGNNTCRKLGMKIKFDEYVDKQQFFGLNRLNFQGYRYDDTYLKEALSYDLYRSMGIVAPRASWALLRVNGEARGLFGMVEDIDKRFVKHNWPDNDQGNLYKEVWPGRTDAQWTTEHLHTNTSNPEISGMMTFTAALNAATPVELRSTLSQFLDLDYLTRYMAVDDAIANFDGSITFYSSGSDAGNHNFYFYEEAANKFTIIPWDLESTLSLVSNYGNIPDWHTTPADCSVQYPVWGGPLKVMAPGCDRLFQALAADPTGYRMAAQQVLDGPFALATMTSNIERYANFIRAEASKDPHGPGAVEFEKSIGFLKQSIPLLRLRLAHFIAGTPSVPQVLTTTAPALTDFESADPYDLVNGTAQLSNPHTSMSVELNAATPLSGTRSARIAFNFANETETWQQWLFYTLPVDTGTKDVTSFTGIRFKVRSNVARPLRINVISPNNSQGGKGIEVGWDTNIGTNTSTVSFLFANAKTPSWATDPQDDLMTILRTVTGIQFMPQCVNRTSSGQLPEGTTDNGWVDVDDIEFF
jgi:spore coat protein CotH